MRRTLKCTTRWVFDTLSQLRVVIFKLIINIELHPSNQWPPSNLIVLIQIGLNKNVMSRYFIFNGENSFRMLCQLIFYTEFSHFVRQTHFFFHYCFFVTIFSTPVTRVMTLLACFIEFRRKTHPSRWVIATVCQTIIQRR